MKTTASPERDGTIRYVAIVGAICAAAILASYAISLHGNLPMLVDRHGVPLGRDFLNTWFYGREFFDHDPGRFYDRSLYMREVLSQFPRYPTDPLWSYPPPFLILAAPFGLLPYVPALAVWSLCGLVVLGLVVFQRGSFWLVAAVLTAPMVVFALIAGQVSLLVGAVILTLFSQLDRRPVVAGFLLSLLVIKPQTVILVPVLLIASRRWAVLMSAAIGTVAIVGLSVALNGSNTWIRFIEIGLPTQVAEMKASIAFLAPISVSVTTAALLSGLPTALVSCLQTSTGLLAAGLVAWVGWQRKRLGATTDYECLVVLTCSIFATPYFLIHDLAAFSAAAIIVAYQGGLIRNRFALLMILDVPVLQNGLSSLNIYIMPWLAVGFAVWLVARRDASGSAGAETPDLVTHDGSWPLASTACQR